MRGIKIPQQDFALKAWGGGGLMREGGWGIFAGHYGISSYVSKAAHRLASIHPPE